MMNRSIFEFPIPEKPMQFDGERYVSGVEGAIQHEHYHRYLFALRYSAGKNVLDVASGEGYGSFLLGQAANSVIGVDLDQGAIDFANVNYLSERVSFRRGDAAKLPIDDQSIDVVVSFETIEHFGRQTDFIMEVDRVLRPDGLLIISSPNREIYSEAHNYKNPFHVREMDRQEFIDLLRLRFSHIHLLEQGAVLGSIIVGLPGDDIGEVEGFTTRDGRLFERLVGVPDAPYFIAVAARQPIPTPPSSVLHADFFRDQAGARFAAHDRARQEQIQSYEAKARHMADTQTALQAELAALRDQASQAQAREQSAAGLHAEQISRLQSALDDVQARLAAAQEEAERREQSILAQHGAQLEQAQAKIDQLGARLTSQEQDAVRREELTAAGHAERIGEIQAAVDQSRAQLAAHKEEAERREREILAQQGARLEQAQAKIDLLVARLTSQEQDAARRQELTAALHAERISLMQAALDDRRAQLAAHKEEAERRERLIHAQHGAQLEQAQATLDGLRARLASQEMDAARHEELTVAGHIKALGLMQAKIDQLEGRLEAQAHDAARREQLTAAEHADRIAVKQAEIAQLEERLTAQARDADRRRQSVVVRHASEIDKMKSANDLLHGRLKAQEQELQTLRRDQERAAHILNEMQARAAHTLREMQDQAAHALQEMQDRAAHGLRELRESAVHNVHDLQERTVRTLHDLQQRAVHTVHGLQKRAAHNVQDLQERAAHNVQDLQERAVHTVRDLQERAARTVRESQDQAVRAMHDWRERAVHSVDAWREQSVRTLGERRERAAQDLRRQWASHRRQFARREQDLRLREQDLHLYFAKQLEEERVRQLALTRTTNRADWRRELRSLARLAIGVKTLPFAKVYIAVASSPLFDGDWYSRRNPDVESKRADPVLHYVLFGAAEGRQPGPLFDGQQYAMANPDVAASKINPLFHFLKHGVHERRALTRVGDSAPSLTPLGQDLDRGFDLDLNLNVDLAPAPRFAPIPDLRLAPDLDLKTNLDLAPNLDLTPTLDLTTNLELAPTLDLKLDLEWDLDLDWELNLNWDLDLDLRLDPNPERQALGSATSDPSFDEDFLKPFYAAAGRSGEPSAVWRKLAAEGAPPPTTREAAEAAAAFIRPFPEFDAQSYRHRLPEGMDPALHYVIVGENLGWTPSRLFDPSFYLEAHPDIKKARISPLDHFIRHGRQEGRKGVSSISRLEFAPLKDERQPILVICHEASRTGAPVLGWNLIRDLRKKHPVVTVLMGGGALEEDFAAESDVLIGPMTRDEWYGSEVSRLAERLMQTYRPLYAVANSIVTSSIVPPLAALGIPVVALVHEFASYTRPLWMMQSVFQWAAHVVFPAHIVAQSAFDSFPGLEQRRGIHVLAQGRQFLPAPKGDLPIQDQTDIGEVMRPAEDKDKFIVLGAGTVQLRKGVDLFLSVAAGARRLAPDVDFKFVWIGDGYDPENDAGYSVYLHEQIKKSELEDVVFFLDPVSDLEPAYRAADVFLMSSRLDPQPNVGIDAIRFGLPTVCFEGASGTAEVLSSDRETRALVAPHLDVETAARTIGRLAKNRNSLKAMGRAVARVGAKAYDEVVYAAKIDSWGCEAAAALSEGDLEILRASGEVDADLVFTPHSGIVLPKSASAEQVALVQSSVVGLSPNTANVYSYFRRPIAGFNPQAYAAAHPDDCGPGGENPTAHWLRCGRPQGPWRHQVLSPKDPLPAAGRRRLRMALHAHFYHPDYAPDLARRLMLNRTPCDLFVSTDKDHKAEALEQAFADHRGLVTIRVMPNRGRDIGPLLTGFADEVTSGDYDIWGHVHGKKSEESGGVGDVWRDFLWETLIGGEHAMLDTAEAAFASDPKLGLLFPEDPNLIGWDLNRGIAENLLERMGVSRELPDFFDFPLGTMLWFRPAALSRLFDLRLDWDDYPPEPLPYDGSLLHALERLTPFVAEAQSYSFATLRVPGSSW